MPTPPRLPPRALFIAALAHAGALSIKLAPVQQLSRLTPSRIERRDRSVRHIVRHLGSAIVAAGRAAEKFARTNTLWAPAVPLAPPLDPRLAVIVEAAPVSEALGVQLESATTAKRDAHGHVTADAWVELSEEPPRLTIYWRGVLDQGDELTTRMKDGRVVDADGHTTGSSRQLCETRFTEAVEAARSALARNGFRPSAFVDIKGYVKRPGFEGTMATIGLLRERPAWLSAPLRSAVRAR